METFSQRYLG